MKAIHRKLVRDIAYMRGQATAIGLVMVCGVATFVMSLSMLDALTGTLDTYYAEHRFADVFTHLTRAPNAVADRMSDIPGVAHVQTRVVERVQLDMPKLSAPASGQIVSLPTDPDTGLNLLHLRSGRYPKDARSREVLVGQRFAEAHELTPGSTITAILNGRLETLSVVGIALSPEFIYLISPGSILPEHERFGVFWMLREEMESAFDMEGAFNDVVIELAPHAHEDAVIDELDALCERYGSLGAYPRADQASHQFLANELRELRGMTLVVPMIFLGVAAFLLNIVMSRMITTQREQIAVLKALGYSQREVGLHYLGFVLLIVLLAGIAGCAVGAWMGRGLTAMYAAFFDFPTFAYELRPQVMVLAILVSGAAGCVGAAHALWRAMRLPPAEAMRPATPPSFKPTLLERLGVHRIVSASIRMILRQLERQPFKTATSVLGVALATAILVVGSFSEDAIEYLIDFQFNRVQRYDMDISFADEVDQSAISTIRHMRGVRHVEPGRALAVRMRSNHRSRRVGVIGLAEADGLYRLLDMSGRPVELPEDGVVLSTVLAESLRVGAGDAITLEVLEGRRPTIRTTVAGLIEDFSGLTAYMNLREMNALLREHRTMGSAYLSVDPIFADVLYTELQEAPQVMAVNVKSATLQSFRDTIGESLGLMRTFLISFSVIIAFGVVYNSARISLSERARDLATLRVIGFTRAEITIIQLGELAIITLIAIPMGLLFGLGLAWMTSQSMDSELIRIPFVIAPSTFGLAASVVLAASIGSGLVVQRRLRRLDLVSVLKSRE